MQRDDVAGWRKVQRSCRAAGVVAPQNQQSGDKEDDADDSDYTCNQHHGHGSAAVIPDIDIPYDETDRPCTNPTHVVFALRRHRPELTNGQFL